MARPSKYNWEAIKEAYEMGFDRDEICKKHRITPKQLSNKISEQNWAVKGTIKSDLKGLSEEVLKHSDNITKLHPANQDLALDVFNTTTQDQELMTNNRKIAKLLQSVIVSSRNEINLKNIKTVSSTLKDIESIANPKPEPISINNTTQTITGVQLIDS